jgi:hypothetical protein
MPPMSDELDACQDFEQILLGDLCQTLDSAETLQTRHDVLVILDAFRENLVAQSKLQDDSRNINLLGEQPEWQARAAALDDQFTDCCLVLERLRNCLWHALPFTAINVTVRANLKSWVQSHVDVRAQETEFLLAASARDNCGEP